jgi:hypothetical protein
MLLSLPIIATEIVRDVSTSLDMTKIANAPRCSCQPGRRRKSAPIFNTAIRGD